MKKVNIMKSKICKNCDDFNESSNTCEIRFLILKDKTKIPLKRSPNSRGCQVYMEKITE